MTIICVQPQVSPDEEHCDRCDARSNGNIPAGVEYYLVVTDEGVSYTLCGDHIEELNATLQSNS